MDLLKNWKKIKAKTKNNNLLLLLDYDGTLSPIVSRPGLATLPAERRKLLKSLAGKDRIVLGIVSGRILKDIKNKVGIKGIYYSGNHGFEIEGPKVCLTLKEANKARPIIAAIKKKLKKELKMFSGIIVEDKKVTLSLHYRLVKSNEQKKLKKAFLPLISPYLKKKAIRLTSGKKVFEIRPPINWDKGKAVKLLLKHIQMKNKKRFLPIYAGDDTTDEDAFAALRSRGITIVVGPKTSKAQYRLKNVEQLYRFLALLLKG